MDTVLENDEQKKFQQEEENSLFNYRIVDNNNNNNKKKTDNDEIIFLTLGDGDFTYSLDLARYLKQSLLSSPLSFNHQNIILIATGIDSYQELVQKYKDIPSTLTDLQKQQEDVEPSFSISIRHGVNAIATKSGEGCEKHAKTGDTVGDVEDLKTDTDDSILSTTTSSNRIAVSYADHVIFHHPHLGTEDAILHHRFLCHLFYSVSNHWLKSHGGSIFHLTLVEGQYERWKCHDAAIRHGFILLHETLFEPPPSFDSNKNKYHYRRHQTGKSFATRRPSNKSITYTFGRETDTTERYIATCLPWQQRRQKEISSKESSNINNNNARIEKVAHTDQEQEQPDSSSEPSSMSIISCPYCKKEFHEERSRKCHIQDKHPDRAEWSYKEQNKKQKKTIKVPASFINALTGFSNSYHCQQCKIEKDVHRIFETSQALMAHQRAKHFGIHTYIVPGWCMAKKTEKIISSDTVEKNVSSSTFISRKCSICDCPLLGERSLTDHFMEFIPTANTEKYPCTFCLKAFREERAKLQHENFCSKSGKKKKNTIYRKLT